MPASAAAEVPIASATKSGDIGDWARATSATESAAAEVPFARGTELGEIGDCTRAPSTPASDATEVPGASVTMRGEVGDGARRWHGEETKRLGAPESAAAEVPVATAMECGKIGECARTPSTPASDATEVPDASVTMLGEVGDGARRWHGEETKRCSTPLCSESGVCGETAAAAARALRAPWSSGGKESCTADAARRRLGDSRLGELARSGRGTERSVSNGWDCVQGPAMPAGGNFASSSS
mmetsp:Transcript_12867/g.45612  ORF Transcript_12867/g.45612 Transcript_12867/m.45612 type:complete len:241 (+) Transcript_12867:325-1047(+)